MEKDTYPPLNKMVAEKEGAISKQTEVAFSDGSQAAKQICDSDSHILQQPNTCRILQRKLELKVEKAKRHYNQYQELCGKKSQSSVLIPINRLQIPGLVENQPLVDYKSDSDDQTEVSFFPSKVKNSQKQELSDTFSIQEMTIESDDSDESTFSSNLELFPPRFKSNIFDTVLNCFYCENGTV